jgi:EmrB/QacA subfamily drug resistance transporter
MNSSMRNASLGKGLLAPKWKVLISVVFGLFMVFLDTTVVNVAFPTLRREFDASLAESQWVLSLYVMALGISTPVAGYLADRFGIKRVYLAGLAVFVLGSMLCGVAPNLGLLIAARALQGLGGGIAIPLGAPQLFRAFPPHEQGTALGFFGIAVATAPALGLILGGWLIDQNLWRWVFFINVPIGLLGVTLGSRFLLDWRSERTPRLDVLGLLTSIVGFGALLYAASIAEARGWTSPAVLIWFAVGAAAVAVFAVIELFVAREPMLDLRLFGKRTFLIANLVGYVSVIALFGAEFLLPLYLQALRGRTALETGLILLPLAGALGIGMPLAGRIYDRTGPRPLLIVGYGLLLLNTWQLSQLRADTPISWILVLLALRGLAGGLTVQTTFVTALSVVPQRLLPRGSSLVNSTRQVVQAIGVAVLATVLVSTLSPEVRQAQAQAQEAQHVSNAPQPGLCEPAAVTGAGVVPVASGAPAGRLAADPSLRQQACDENVAGFERTYQLTFYAALLALGLGALLPGWPFAWAGRRAADAPAAAAH